MKLFAIVLAISPATLAFAPGPAHLDPSALARTDAKLMATRRDALAEIATGFAFATSQPAVAETVVPEPMKGLPADNEIIKEQRQVTGKIDVNNSPVADYMRLPGMYPKIGGKIANNGPYGSVKDVYKLTALTKDEIKQIKKYESILTATPATGLDTLRGRDPYRRSFNQ